MQRLAQQKRATFHESLREDEIVSWQRKKKGRDSVSEWDVWHAADFFDLAGPRVALALKYRQQRGRDGKEGERDHVWKKEDGIALLHLVSQVNWELFSVSAIKMLFSLELPMWFYPWHTLYYGWMDGWRGGEKRWEGGGSVSLVGLAKWAESKWCRSTLADSVAPLITFNQSYAGPTNLTAKLHQSLTFSHLFLQLIQSTCFLLPLSLLAKLIYQAGVVPYRRVYQFKLSLVKKCLLLSESLGVTKLRTGYMTHLVLMDMLLNICSSCQV